MNNTRCDRLPTEGYHNYLSNKREKNKNKII